MSMDIETRARQAVEHIARLVMEDGAPDRIVVASYTHADYDALHDPETDMSWDDHMRTIDRLAELLMLTGIADRVIFQDINAEDYRRWLSENELPDSHAARGAFAELVYHGRTGDIKDIEALRNVEKEGQ